MKRIRRKGPLAMSAVEAGRVYENMVVYHLRSLGWRSWRAAGFDGPVDVVAVGNKTNRPHLLVQCKRGGRMAKIKRRDFGLPWPIKESP